MTDIKVNGFFVSEKVSKIRWLPEQFRDADRFLTGSWDANTNFVKIWRLLKSQYSEDEESSEYVPKCNDKIPFDGDVTGLELLDSENLLVSSSDGYLTVLKAKRADVDSLRQVQKSELLHKFASGRAAPCTAISVHGKDVATVGEDGRLNIMMIGTSIHKVKSYDNADHCSLTAISYVSPKEILTANRMGTIKVFDTRAEDNELPLTLHISCEDDRKCNYVSCLTYHPTQNHIIFAGSEEGSITVWDLRQPNFPASYLTAHSSAISDIGFHKTQPSKLFTASENGELWQWSQNTMTSLPSNVESQLSLHSETDNINPWLNGERTKSKVNVTALTNGVTKSINCFDASGSKIICGCDNEAVYCIDIDF